MAEPVLLLRLESPMQSWGTRSRWDVRDTGREPTKSGIIGLIGCALGLRRDEPELERLDRDLVFGVRIDRPGVISTDYQTVSGYHRTASGGYKHSGGVAKNFATVKNESTIVSFRDYLHDAAFLVALTSHDHELLAQLAGEHAHPGWPGDLLHPYWPLYLGRKSCVPARPILDPRRPISTYDDMECAFHNEPLWAVPRAKDDTPPKLEAWIEDPGGDVERQDAIRLNQLRFYGFRRCRRIEICTDSLRRDT